MKEPLKGIDDNRILTLHQKLFLNKFTKSELREAFRLTGGTALSAFYLEHRLSEDLDFFSSEKIPLSVLEEFLKSLDNVKDISFSRLFDRNLFNLKLRDDNFLKVEFSRYSLKNIEACPVVDHLTIDGFLDIIVNKLCAVADRSDAKDYVDIYCALKNSNLSLKRLMALAENKCDIKGIGHVLKSRLLQMPSGLDRLPLIKDLTEIDVKVFFEKNIREIIASENNR